MTHRYSTAAVKTGLALALIVLSSTAALTFPKPQTKSSEVISVTLTASPDVYDGQCPVTIKFSGSIAVKGKGPVKYTFIRSDGATGPIDSLDFDDGETKSVNTTWTLSPPQFAEWVAIRILSPNELESNKAFFKGTCLQAQTPPGKEQKGSPKPDSVIPKSEIPKSDPVVRSVDPVINPAIPKSDPVVRSVDPVIDPAIPKSDPVVRSVDPTLPKSDPVTRSLPLENIGSNWDFENGLSAWTPTGNAFDHQPTLGDAVLAERVRTDMTLERGGIGGDYWKRIPYPIGHHLDAWIGTNENHPYLAATFGVLDNNSSTGTLTSGEFALDAGSRFIAFVVGGGRDVATERVELQVRGENATDLAEVERIVRGERGAYSALAGLFGGTPGGTSAVPLRDGNYVIALTASGQNSEVMRSIVFDVPSSLRGRRGRIRIVDNSGGPWGHINADDFRFENTRPADRPTRVWGFADTHAHPMNELSFGGNVVQGSLYARDGSVFGSEQNRRKALPPIYENVPWAGLGAVGGLLSLFYASPLGSPGFRFPPIVGPAGGAIIGEAARVASLPSRMGYPSMRGYPSFSAMAGQMMYGEWIRRAYDGGLRLMSALAVNNWLVSSHSVKRAVLGSPQPEDDVGSANAQVAYLKGWTSLPENRGWVEIARTPADARRIIGANKLALVIGLELDVIGNFVPAGPFRERGTVVMPSDTAEQRVLIAREVKRLYEDEDVRQVGPFHYVSGVFGGSAIFQRLFNEVSRKVTGQNIQVVSGNELGIRYRLDMDGWDVLGDISRTLATGDLPARQNDRSWSVPLGNMNERGLSPAGHILFDELAKRGMLIDVDHASFRSTEDMLREATRRGYPLMTSHTNYLELGFTGRGDYSHGAVSDNDIENFALFGTTILSSLRREGMVSRTQLEKIANSGGVTGAILWLPRLLSFGNGVPNDAAGSSKTWAQAYQYAVSVTGGRGVALSTDRITMEPRFGPNAAYELGTESKWMPQRDEIRFGQVDAQRNGVRYDKPIVEWRAYRFGSAGVSAWSKTRAGFGWEQRELEHGDGWKAIAAWAAGRNPRTMPNYGDIGDPPNNGRIINYAWGLWSRTEMELQSDCGLIGCTAGTLDQRYAAYCVKSNLTPFSLARCGANPQVVEQARWFSTVWREWGRMTGTNEPLRRHIFGTRDFDVNIDGVAHYGMLPDFLQDVANSHSRPAEVGIYLDPLFRSAESYITMWEKARMSAGLRDRDR